MNDNNLVNAAYGAVLDYFAGALIAVVIAAVLIAAFGVE